MEIRNKGELRPFIEEFGGRWLAQFGEVLEPEHKHDIYCFAGYAAVIEGYTLQTSLMPIKDFARLPTTIKNVAELSFLMHRYPGDKSGPGSCDHIISSFVAFMAERKGLTFQRAVQPVDDFAPHIRKSGYRKGNTATPKATVPVGEKPQWECPLFLSNCFDLQASNWENINTDNFRELLENVTRPKSDLEKNFELKAATMFKEWFDFPKMPLPEETYAVLNNWAFGDGAWYKGKSTAVAAGHLWDALFCIRPHERLTDPKVNGGKKILPERFKLWWPKQQKCQGERDNSVKGRVISAWKQANKPNWSIEQTLKVCVRIDSELEEAGLQPAPRFRDAVKYLVNWVQGCHFPWLNPR